MRSATRAALGVLLAAAWLSPPVLRADGLKIAEFMAENVDTLVDSDGDSSDWIEVFNDGPTAVDLAGWSLTDAVGVPDKWRFPPLSIEAGGRLLVFASGKDRRESPDELHTNFRLDAAGEYLALVRPDGGVAHEFAPAYPQQFPDISYGIGQAVEVDSLLPDGVQARYRIPTDASDGVAWTGGAEPFADAAWARGPLAVGYVSSVPGFAVRNVKADVAVGDLATAEQVLSNPGLQESVAEENAASIDYFGTGGTGHYANNRPFPGTVAGSDIDDFVVEATGLVTLPQSGAWTFGVSSDDGFGLDIGSGAFRISFPSPRGPGDTLGVFNAPAAGEYPLRLVFYERGGGSELELFAVRGSAAVWANSFRLVGDVASGGLAVRSQAVGGAVAGNYRELIGSDVQAAMLGLGSSAYVRIAFDVADPAAFRSLTLRALYDDGLIAYLNGVEVARRNAPGPAAFDAVAAADRPPHLAMVYEDINVSAQLGHLKAGANVLALHGLNDSRDGRDFLIGADLAEVTTVSMAENYFKTATPGAANEAGFLDVVRDTRFSVDRGFFDAPFEVAVSTATPGATIRYTLDGSAPTSGTGAVYTGPIPIARSTVLRAAAFKAGFISTNVDTHTYIFVEDVIRQTFQSTLDAGFPATWGSVAADYGMDPRVAGQGGADGFGGKYAASIRDDLKAVPTLSIALRTDDMFGPNGIYTNSGNRGLAWERACSAELIYPDGTSGFQVDCGIRIHGGAFRSHGLTLKHSMRLIFKALYGPTKLRYPFFGPDGSDRIDTVVLRANTNDHWVWAGANAVFLRDSFSRETVLDMGGVASRENWVHLYINGIYWGLYNPVERPDASFSATYFGATDSPEKDDWDALSNGSVSSGSSASWNTLVNMLQNDLSLDANYQALQGNLPDGADDPARPSYVDVDNLIDYMIANIYIGNSDWPGHNWWIGRSRVNSTGFKFYLWDAEWSLLLNSGLDTNRTDASSSVAAPYAALRANAEFRMRFADRVQRCFANGGPLHVDPSNPSWDPDQPQRNVPAARLARLTATIERAIVAESARWGDQKATSLRTRDEHWRPALESIFEDYLPFRSARVLSQLRGAALYPSIDAPVFSPPGGRIADRLDVSITTFAGTIYYTLDGADPRLPGGAVSPAASVSEGAARSFDFVLSGADVRVLVPVDGALGLSWTQPGFNDAAWTAGRTGVGFERSSGYEALIQTDVGAAMYNINSSVYVRLAFDVPADAEVFALTLRMKYDDGFIGYLNGARVASRNAPETPLWNSGAAAANADSSAVVFEDIDITPSIGALRSGRNVLAIHGLNSGSGSSDMLIVPELRSSEVTHVVAPVDGPMTVRARSRLNGEWSALNEVRFVDDLSDLRLTEFLYHPSSAGPDSPYSSEDFEFIEFQNVGTRALSLAGLRLGAGVDFVFPSEGPGTILAPGDHVVVVKDLAAFRWRYDDPGILIAGEFDGQLDNGGELILVLDALGEPIADFVYSDRWYPATDGGGASMVIVDALLPVEDWQDPASWRPSAAGGGSPGYPDDGSAPSGGWQVPGDSNQDGVLNLSDVVSLLSRLFLRGELELPCEGASLGEGANAALLDANGDSRVDVSDGIRILQYLFKSGAAPVLGTECVRIEGCGSRCVR